MLHDDFSSHLRALLSAVCADASKCILTLFGAPGVGQARWCRIETVPIALAHLVHAELVKKEAL